MIREKLRKERVETEKAKLEAFSVMCRENADLENENQKLREQLGRVRELLRMYVDLHYKPVKTESELRSEAEKFLKELG